MASSSSDWIVGILGLFLHWNGSDWSETSEELTYATLRGVLVAIGDGAQGWAVGHDGEVCWLQGGTWKAGCALTVTDLWAVEMVSRYEAWAVGDAGAIPHWVSPHHPEQTERAYLPLSVRYPRNPTAQSLIASRDSRH